MTPSDEDLVRRHLAGDRDAFPELLRRHELRVYNIALRMTGRPEDARDAMWFVVGLGLTALAVGFLVAVGLGAINGALVVITRLNGLVITLATMTILIGVQYALVAAYTVDQYPDELKELKLQGVGPVPWIFLASLAGIPPLGGWIAKFSAFRAVLEAGNGWAYAIAVIGAVNSVVAFGYYGNIMREIWMRPVPHGDAAPVVTPSSLQIALGITALATLVIGILPGTVLHLGDLADLVGAFRG